MDRIICPKCNKSIFDKKYEKDGLYVCANPLPEFDGCACGTIIGIKCLQCDMMFDEDRFGLRNDVYECKYCGRPQWAYTEYKREHNAIINEMNAYIQFMNSQLSQLQDKYK